MYYILLIISLMVNFLLQSAIAQPPTEISNCTSPTTELSSQGPTQQNSDGSYFFRFGNSKVPCNKKGVPLNNQHLPQASQD